MYLTMAETQNFWIVDISGCMLGHYYKVTISIWDDRIAQDGLIFIASVYSFVIDSELRLMHDAFNTRVQYSDCESSW